MLSSLFAFILVPSSLSPRIISTPHLLHFITFLVLCLSCSLYLSLPFTATSQTLLPLPFLFTLVVRSFPYASPSFTSNFVPSPPTPSSQYQARLIYCPQQCPLTLPILALSFYHAVPISSAWPPPLSVSSISPSIINTFTFSSHFPSLSYCLALFPSYHSLSVSIPQYLPFPPNVVLCLPPPTPTLHLPLCHFIPGQGEKWVKRIMSVECVMAIYGLVFITFKNSLLCSVFPLSTRHKFTPTYISGCVPIPLSEVNTLIHPR